MMGSGKTTVGELIAREMGLMFIDTDSLIESEQGRPIGSIWESGGEDGFRDLESEQIDQIAASGQDCVIATGGGAVLRSENIATMRRCGTVVWLAAEPGELWSRVGGSETRPLLLDAPDEHRLADILDGRREFYEAAAHFTVETGPKDTAAVAREVMVLWNGS
jgi:shikimate kinase